MHSNADSLSQQTPCLNFTHCATIQKRVGGPSGAEIYAELHQIREIPVKDPVAQDQTTRENLVARIYKALQTGEPVTAEKLQLGGTE